MKNLIIIFMVLCLLIFACNKAINEPETERNITINVFDNCGSLINNYKLMIDSTIIFEQSNSSQTVIKNIQNGSHTLAIESGNYLNYSTTFLADSITSLNVTLIRKFDFKNLFKLGNKWVYNASSISHNDLKYLIKEIKDSLSNGTRVVEVKWIYQYKIVTNNEYWVNYKGYYLVAKTYENISVDSNSCFIGFSYYNPTDIIKKECSYYFKFARDCGEYLNQRTSIQNRYYKYTHQVLVTSDTAFVSSDLGLIYDKYYYSNSLNSPPNDKDDWQIRIKGLVIGNKVIGDTTLVR